MSSVSPSADVAIAHLMTVRPNDGWSVKRDRGGVRLYRRNIPLTDNVFLDVHYDAPSRCVVGMVSRPTGDNPIATAQVLVGPGGSPTSDKKLVQVRSYRPDGSTNRVSSGSLNRPAAPPTHGTLTDEQNKELLKYVGIAIGSLMVLKIFVSKLSLLIILVLPLVYVYAANTRPAVDSFDAKKELKRVLRGHNLPDTHPDKPRGMLGSFMARVAASVTTELATLPGYTICKYDLAGAAHLVSVHAPTVETEFFWVGAFDNWHHMYTRKKLS